MNNEILEILAEFKEGNLSRFESFYEYFKKKVFYSIYSLTRSFAISEDLLLETFVKFLKNVKDLDLNKSVLSYLITIGRNITLNYLEREKRIEPLEDVDYNHSYQMKIEDNSIFIKMKDVLSSKEYQVVIYHVLDELSHKEIASIMNLPLGSVTWIYNNSLKKLRKELEHYA